MIRRLPPYWFNKTGKTQRGTTTTTNGSVATVYTDYLASIRLRFNPKGGAEHEGAGRLTTFSNYIIYVNGAPDITATDRIIFDNSVFDVLNVNNVDEAGAYLKIEAAQVEPSGVGA